MSDFTILHLSDAHIGHPKYYRDSLEVMEPLITDLRNQVSDGLKPSLVVFSGDLVYGKLTDQEFRKQFDYARKWLDNVYSVLCIDYSTNPIILVPGNHDINRERIDNAQRDWVSALKEGDAAKLDEEICDKSALWRRLLERQEEWWSFVRNLPTKAWVYEDNFHMCYGTIKAAKHSVGVVGVNTSWACSGDQDKGALWVGTQQAQLSWQVVKDCDLKIAVSHHPTGWMHSGERLWTAEKLESKFNLHFHGHEHSQFFYDPTGHVCVSAGPCYGGSTKENAYSWVTVDIANRQAVIHCRTYEQKGRGGWKAYAIPDKTDENGCRTLDRLFVKGVKRLSLNPNKSVVEPATKRPRRPRMRNLCSSPMRRDMPIEEYLEELKESFNHIWEPATFRNSARKALVYWPVRLRKPTPIHAVQTFVAAGFLQCGAKVILCLDDLGNVENGTATFPKAVRRWIKQTSGRSPNFKILTMSKIKQAVPLDMWDKVKQWFAHQTDYKLLQVLSVSKLIPRNDLSSKLLELEDRKSRQLLTPVLVWTSLKYVIDRHNQYRFITLGGHDERPLWRAWRDCMSDGSEKVGHLYVPELRGHQDGGQSRTLSMTAGALAWDSVNDIENALQFELRSSSQEAFIEKGRMAHWCYSGCVQLPSFLKGVKSVLTVDGSSVESWEDLCSFSPDTFIPELARGVGRWLV